MKFSYYLLCIATFFISVTFFSCTNEKNISYKRNSNYRLVPLGKQINRGNLALIFGKIEYKDFRNQVKPVKHSGVFLNGAMSFADAQGKYKITLSPGAYRMQVGTVGFVFSDLNLNLKAGDSTRINFMLKADTTTLH